MDLMSAIIGYLMIGLTFGVACVVLDNPFATNVDDIDDAFVVAWSILLWPVFTFFVIVAVICWTAGKAGRWLGRRLRR